ncbi:MAG: SLBB domain-containing protein [Actinomycetota bacterium]|nr:SLBB domain-containing protein [Actinomycetota bacterium]
MPLLPFLLPESPVTSLEQYLELGGGEGVAKARRLGPEAVIDEITRSGLRGRGGGGFPTGVKWASTRSVPGRHYVVCNAAEGEPATFKDRALMRANPYQCVEGLAIAALCMDAPDAYLGTKAKFEVERLSLEAAIQEMDAAGLLEGLTMVIAAGPDEYLFGEEKALLEVIEGHDPMPRLMPPFQHGLFATGPQLGWEAHAPEPGHAPSPEANPTLVNNLETLANVAHILSRGADWFRRMGTAESPGTIVCTVVGDVARAGVHEMEMGSPLSELLEAAGGPPQGRQFKAAFSGVANAVIHASDFDTPLSYEAMSAIGSGLGAGGFALYDDSACMVAVAREYSRFLSVESCGQCPPCKQGSMDITAILAGIEAGTGSETDVEALGRRLQTVTDANRCYLGTEEQLVVSSVLQTFPEEVATHLEGWCEFPPRHVPIPKLDDIVDGTAVYDERHARKRPDWTYAEP